MDVKARVWTEVDASAIRHNAEFAKRHTGAQLIAVVKADAYGHGVENAIPALRDLAALFAVANVDEAAAVKALAPEKPILLLSSCLPWERAVAAELGCIVTISSAEEAASYGAGVRVSLKVDTGMGRIGVWHENALEEIRKIRARSQATLHSVATHLPVADEDAAFTQKQLAGFAEFCAKARALAPDLQIHALNSAAICTHPEKSFDLVRAGLMLYGSASPRVCQPHLEPALAWKCRVLLVRDVPTGRSISYGRTFISPRPMRVATLSVGYADGYPRQASGRDAHVLVGGNRCALLGRVTMDQIMVDVSDVPEVHIADEAVLVGAQGDQEILAAELAEWGDTIAWDIFTGIGGRTKRLSVGACVDSD